MARAGIGVFKHACNIENVIFQGGSDEFHVKTANSVDEACKLLEVGFEYVCDMDGMKLFRKRK